MRNTLPTPLVLLLISCCVGIMTVCSTGCQRSSSGDLGTIVSDLSQVPGTDTPYQLPDLGDNEPKKPENVPTNPVDKPPVTDKLPTSAKPSGTSTDNAPHATRPPDHP